MPKIGRWYPLAERLSRWARICLLRVALKKQTRASIANVCGVSRQAVTNWLKKEAYHPSDKNASVLLRLAWHIDEKRVKEILRADAKRYSSELRKIRIAF